MEQRSPIVVIVRAYIFPLSAFPVLRYLFFGLSADLNSVSTAIALSSVAQYGAELEWADALDLLGSSCCSCRFARGILVPMDSMEAAQGTTERSAGQRERMKETAGGEMLGM